MNDIVHQGSPLAMIRSQRDQMSAVERRIADYVLDNAQLLRDYSSQQLANALGVSQSSVVKFSQKLGFKGYPDLKYSVGEAVVRAESGKHTVHPEPDSTASANTLADKLWQRKLDAEHATRLLNPPEVVAQVADAIAAAEHGKVFLIGFGEDDIHARGFALKLAMLGIPIVHNFDAARMVANISTVEKNDVLMVFSEFGNAPALCKISRWFRETGGKVITVTRHNTNPLRSLADAALMVSAHDEAPELETLLYRSALQHLLDGVFLRLCEDEHRRDNLRANQERIQTMLEP